MTAPLIVTATFADADFQWLDTLRRRHFPAERNRVPAHLTMFHHLPPSELPDIRRRLRDETRNVAVPQASLVSVRNLGRGVALDVRSPALADIRNRLAEALEPLLIPQDQASWRPHITIQNTVESATAKALHAHLSEIFRCRPLAIRGLALWRYQGGPWEAVGHYPFS